MAVYRRLFFVLILFTLLMASCTKPVLLGSDFLEDEKASLSFKDDFGLSFFTEKSDTIVVHSKNVSRQLYTYLLGHLDDPFFGKSNAEIFAQPLLPTVASALKGSVLDSVILQLRYDTLGSYGDLNQPVTIEVYRLNEEPDFDQTYFSDQTFMHNAEILGSLTFIPKPKDSTNVIHLGDTSLVAPHIRIPLNTMLLSDLTNQDSIVYAHIDSFLNYFNGLYIRMTNASNTMIGINLVNAVSGLSVYYRRDTLPDREFKFVFTSGSVKTVHLEHDYAGTPVGASLGTEAENDYWYVQGMDGVTTSMKIDGLSELGDAIINEADLEVYCTFPDGDDPTLFPPLHFLITQQPTDTALVNSVDVNVGLSRSNGNILSAVYASTYGGVLTKVTSGPPAVYKYQMKVTAQVKDIYDGKKENIIYFNPIDKGNVPGRAIFLGPSNPLYAPRLRVYYTAL